MRGVVLLWLLALGSCATAQPLAPSAPASPSFSTPTADVGITVDRVLSAYAAYAPNCDGLGGDWQCWGHPSGNTYLGLVTAGPRENAVEMVKATYSVPGFAADQDAARGYFEALARFPYTGGDPEAAATWVRNSWRTQGNHRASTDIGPAHFILRISNDDGGVYSLVIRATNGSFD